ncbi:hypothetical protein ABMY12_20655 [Vibrio vulnificus]|uniref:hypothetical protein n=2 Tax=Vibrio TaxID=662 RepID=UPI0008D9A1FE
MRFTFEVNRCFDDPNKDEVHEFGTLKAMREFIDIDDCYPMEVTVYKNGEQVVTVPHSCYWHKDKHPTLKQLIS